MKKFGKIMLGFAFAIIACFSVVLVGCEEKNDSTSPSSPAAGLYQNGVIVKSWEDLKEEFPGAFIGTSIIYMGNIYSDNFQDSSYFQGLCGELVIDNSITEIGFHAFINCKNLENIVIPDSVTSIGAGAFSGCENLQKVSLSDGLKNIGESAFYECGNLQNIVIPDSVTSIGFSAFSGCTSLERIVIPDSVTGVESFAFYGCGSLTSITIPDSVRNIESFAFSSCESLTNITIPYGVTSIGFSAFSGCTSLERIVIPDSVTSIGSGAFYGCDNLEMVIIESAEIAAFDSPEFSFSSSLLFCAQTLYVKSGLSVGSDVTDIFEKQTFSDKQGFDKYLRKQ